MNAVDVAKCTYLALLQMPMCVWRCHHQEVYCRLRDFIAEETCQSAEDVQNEYEEAAATTPKEG